MRIFLAGAVSILAGCGTLGPDAPTAFVRPTSTPISTPLPQIATPVPAGFPANPVQMLIVPNDADITDEMLQMVEDNILQVTNVSVDVVPVNSMSEALAMMCDTSTDLVSVAWLDGLAYAAALAQNCGSVELQLRSVTEQNGDVGEAGHIILSRSLGTSDLTSLRGRSFCRIAYDDLYSWLLPTMVFKLRNVNPLDFTSITDYPNISALIGAVAEGECDGAGVPASIMDNLIASGDPQAEDVAVVYTSPVIPQSLLVLQFETPSAVRISLADLMPMLRSAMQAPAEAEADSETASEAEATPETDSEASGDATPMPAVDNDAAYIAVFGDSEIVRPETETLSGFTTFLDQTGLNFTDLGR